MLIETSADARRSKRHAAGGGLAGPAADDRGYLDEPQCGPMQPSSKQNLRTQATRPTHQSAANGVSQARSAGEGLARR